jgi:hypothetical protein
MLLANASLRDTQILGSGNETHLLMGRAGNHITKGVDTGKVEDSGQF